MKLNAATLRVLALAGAVVSLSAPAGAGATRFEVPRLPGSVVAAATVPVVVGAQPVGDGVVYASGSYAGGWTVWLASPGGARHALAVVPAPPGASSDQIVVRASPTRLVVVHTAGVCGDPTEGCKYGGFRTLADELLAGPLAGPLVRVACHGGACGTDSSCPDGGPGFTAVLGGDLLAARDNCTGTLGLANLATGTSRTLGSASAWAVAGGFVAVTQPTTDPLPAGFATTIVVRDAASGAEIYRAGVPALNFAGSPQFAILVDGTVVYTAPLSGGVALVLASPAAPAGRVLRYEGPGPTILGAGPAGVLTLSPPSALELVPLDGSPSLAIPFAATGNVAFDGRTIVLTQGSCVTNAITTWRVGDPAPPPSDDRCPTPSPAGPAAMLLPDRRLRFALGCPATAPGGCPATVDLTARRGPRRRGAQPAGRRSYPLGRVQVALDAGRRGEAEVLVSPAAARWVRQHAPLRLTIAVRNTVCCADRRPPGDPGAITRTVPLRVSTG